MMLNQCTFIGNLGADPEVKRLQSGDPVVNLSLGVSEKWKTRDGEQKERTEWVRAVLFGDGLCRVAESYLRKGSKILIQGKMATRKWQDQNGQDRYSTEIVLSGPGSILKMLDGKSEGQGGQQPTGQGSGHAQPSPDLDDDIPF